ncbi:MAG: hypothetical protein BCS36_12690 [Desulfovibrio sp. MES5]|nr:MAG: hypothetical protein BCS36_12690 [Desulfovibrio sp. MES5]
MLFEANMRGTGGRIRTAALWTVLCFALWRAQPAKAIIKPDPARYVPGGVARKLTGLSMGVRRAFWVAPA